jgi:hypothetical protein
MEMQEIQIEISGSDVHPETLRMNELAHYLLNLHEAVIEEAETEGCTFDEEQPDITLVGIDDQCVLIRIMVSLMLLPCVANISQAIRGESHTTLGLKACAAINRIKSQTMETGHQFRICQNDTLQIANAIIAPTGMMPWMNQESVEDTFQIQGITSIYGECIGIGGIDKPYAMIKTQQGTVRVFAEKLQVKKLAGWLYEPVKIDGMASWQLPDMALKSMNLCNMERWKKIPINEAFQQLRKIAGDRFDDTDAEQYVKTLRYGDDTK